MKAKRYVYEFASAEKRFFERMARENADGADIFRQKIHDIDRAVWSVERGYITDLEAVRIIAAPLSD